MRVDREHDWERSTLITELVVLGERAANIRLARRDEFVVTADGSFFIAQLLCNRAAVQAGVYETQARTVEIDRGPADVIASIRDELAARYRSPILQFAAFDAQPPPRGAGLSLLWLLTRSTEGFVSLKEARLRFPSLGPVFDWFLLSNLSRCFEDHPELRGLLYFNRSTGTLTMEDPSSSSTSARSTGPSSPRPVGMGTSSFTRPMGRSGRWSARPGSSRAASSRPARSRGYIACFISRTCTSRLPIRPRSGTRSSQPISASRGSSGSMRWWCRETSSTAPRSPSTPRRGCSSSRSSRGSRSQRKPWCSSRGTTTSAGRSRTAPTGW